MSIDMYLLLCLLVYLCEFCLTNFYFLVVLDIDLKVAAKFFGTKFACGSSVTGDDEIVIQGDVKDDLFDIIPEKWPEVRIYLIQGIFWEIKNISNEFT